jgi:methyl coenzyme M reductase beta subunit
VLKVKKTLRIAFCQTSFSDQIDMWRALLFAACVAAAVANVAQVRLIMSISTHVPV